MTWVMSLPKHSGSEKRNVAADATSGTLDCFSAAKAAMHAVGSGLAWIHFRYVLDSGTLDSDILTDIAEATAL